MRSPIIPFLPIWKPAKALCSPPEALDLFTWLSYQCFVARGEERISLFGEFGLANQLGCLNYSRPRRFRENDAEAGAHLGGPAGIGAGPVG